MRLRLALSYLAVILLFLITMGIGWLTLTAHPGLTWLSEQLEDAYRQDQRILLPPGSQLTLYPVSGNPRVLQGDGRPPDDPQALARARDGQKVFQRRIFQRQATVWIPLQDGGVLALSAPASLPAEVQRNLLLAALAGALMAFLAGLWLSSRIADPVQRLAEAADRLGAGALAQRVPVSGAGELAELGRRFNQMAERLEESMKRLSEAEKAQRQFLSDLSHNLRTPLSAVQGWTEALLDGLAQGEEERHLERIRREVLFVSQTLQRLVDLSRWESQDPLLREEAFPLQDPLLEVVDTLAPAAEAAQVRLDLEGDLHCQVKGDRQRVRELFQILLENAVAHAGDKASINVKIQREHQHAAVTVSDDGKGFELGRPPEKLRAGGRGPGLGLAIARRLARAHGGELELHSAPGQGTRARFTLSLQTSEVV